MRKTLITTLFIATFGAMCVPTNAQTVKEATQLYNTTAQSYKQDFKAGIANFNKVLEMCEAVGEECDEIKMNTQNLIPRVYFEYAMSLYKKKDLEGTLTNLEASEDLAAKYNNAEIKKRATRTLPKLYVAMGSSKLKENKYDEALANYNKALAANPNLIDAQVYITATYQKMDNDELMVESLQKTVVLAKKVNKPDVGADALNRLKNFYLKKAEDARVAKSYGVAIGNYEKSISYDSTDAEVFRNFSNACFQAENWDKTIEVALRAIELNKGADIEKAELYYELATAYHKTNNVNKACEAYKKAAFGEYKPNAEYQIKTLKCQ